MIRALSLTLCLLTSFASAAESAPPPPGTHAHYAVLSADWESPAPFAAVDIVYGPREQADGQPRFWWQLEIRKDNDIKTAPLCMVRFLSDRDPLADATQTPRIQRYILRASPTTQPLEYRDIRSGTALLPAWRDFEHYFILAGARGALRQSGISQTATLLGHTLTLQWAGSNVAWQNWDDVKRVDLDRELLVGTGRNFRDAELHRLPQTPNRQEYKYVRFTRDEYRVMIDAGINLYVVDPEQSTWIQDRPVFYHRSIGGDVPLIFPTDLYRSNYLGPVMFMDEPAILMVGDRNINTKLQYFSDAASVLEQRIRAHYRSANSYSGFLLEQQFQKAGVHFGDMRLEQCDFPAWETMYETAHYQLEAGLAGIVHEGRYRLAQFDRELAKWDKPRQHTGEQMLRYHYAFLRGAARANGRFWGTSIYGQAEQKYSPLAVTLAYDMGARYVWFWTSDHDHHMPWPEQLELARTLKQHATQHPRPSIYGASGRSVRPTVETAIVIPYGWFLELGNTWWIRAIDKDGKSEYAQRFARLMRRAHEQIHATMDRNEDFDLVVDTGKPIEGYRRLVQISAD